ncbi:MAG: ABC transporter permease [Jatrophihabitans sp.]
MSTPTTTTTTTVTRSGPEPAPAAPAAPIPFSRLLHVEWGKATDTRSARWLIAVTGAATVLIMLAPLLARNSIDQNYSSYLQFAALALTALLPVVAILTLTTEWTQRTVLTTFTQEPRRARVISAKVSVALLMAAIAIVFGGLVTAAAIGVAEASGRHVVADLGSGGLIGFVLFVLVNILMGVAFGALLHNTAASVVLFFLLPTVFGILGRAVNSVGKWIDPGTTFNWMLDGDWNGHAAGIVITALIWLVLPLSAGLVRTVRREIK